MAEDGYPVKLHVYDISQGMARQLSASILGKVIEAIWHTGIVVYGREYYFGGGIQHGQPGRTPYGTPVRVEDLGVTHVPREVFEDFLREIGPRYTPATYNLLSHNCNTFSNEAAQFLTGAGIPAYILDLPTQVMNSPVGALILPMLQGLETSLRAGAVPQEPPQLTPAATPPLTDVDVAARSSLDTGKSKADETKTKTVDSNDSTVPPAAQPATAQVSAEPPATAAVAQVSAAPAPVPAPVPAAGGQLDPLVEAKNRATIMATGTARAGEAAAMATRRVMERHGLRRTASAMPRG